MEKASSPIPESSTMPLFQKSSAHAIRPFLDILLALLLILQLALPYLGAFEHEWAGVALGILCIVHLVLNLSMLSGLARTRRRGRLALDILLIAWLVLEVLSGLGMSLYVTPWLMLPDSFLLSRSTHALLGYWGFVLAAIHAGFHVPAIRAQLARHLFKRPTKRRNTLFQAIIAVAGIASALALQFPEHLVPLQPLFSSSEMPVPLFLALLVFAFWGIAAAADLAVSLSKRSKPSAG